MRLVRINCDLSNFEYDVPLVSLHNLNLCNKRGPILVAMFRCAFSSGDNSVFRTATCSNGLDDFTSLRMPDCCPGCPNTPNVLLDSKSLLFGSFEQLLWR